MGKLRKNRDLGDSYSSDDDTVDVAEISKIFKPCELVTEKVISKNYILHLTGNSETNPCVAASSLNTVEVLKFENSDLASITTLSEHKSTIIDVKFATENNTILYSSCAKEGIKVWDLRVPQHYVSQMTDTSDENGQKKLLTCFDVSPDNRLLAAGTELYEADAYILFWDIRNTKLLGGYWESHTDDITDVKFDPNDRNSLTSGSTDGLINIYDLTQSSEDDALTDTLNSESSIETLTWFRTKDNSDAIACVTHMAELQLWKTDECQPFAHFRRNDIADGIKILSADHCYIAGTYYVYDNNLLLLAGSNSHDGQCVRGLYADGRNLYSAYNLIGNKQRIRSSWCNTTVNKILITSGEKGIINAWKL